MINKEVNIRTTLTIPKELKSHLEVLAKEDHRSVNNLIVTILDNYVKDKKSDYKQKNISKRT